MVLFKANETHFTSIMTLLNQLRRDKIFCDVILKIGSDEIHAHRSVLAAGCPYFNSLFLGQFTEASMKEINLSEVTDDIAALEVIVNFIYSGQVEINMENLGVIVKLSSFFLLENLRVFSAEFMEDSLCLRTCLKYYLYAAEHGITNVEVDSEQMIESRFHDFHIFEESTLNLTPDQLACLTEKDVFKHCSTYNVIQFVAKWVEKGKSNAHIEFGLEILADVKKKNRSPVFSGLNEACLQALYEKVIMTFENCDFEKKDNFVLSLKSAIDTVLYESMPTNSPNIDQPSTSTCVSESGLKNKMDDTELALITLSPKLCVIEDYKKAREGGLIHHEQELFTESVFDVCAYIPRTRCWYYVCALSEHEGMPDYLVDGAGYESRLYVLGDNMAFVDNRGDVIDFYNMKEHSWQAPGVQYHDHNFDFDFDNVPFQANDVCYVVGNKGEKYMIVRIRIFTDASYDQAIEMYFRGYTLCDDGESWDCIFLTTSRIRTNLSDSGGVPEMNARISKTSNEMIVTHSTLDGGWNIAFIVNLNDSSPVPTMLKSEFIEDQDIFRGIVILEEKDKFIIVSNGTKNCNHEVKMLYEYKFKSCELTEVSVPSIVIATITKPYVYDDEEVEYPCLCEFSACDGESIWYIEGNLGIVSAFTEVRLDGKHNLVTRKHTPPPFSCITKAFAGYVKSDLVSNLKRITRFLIKEKPKIRKI